MVKENVLVVVSTYIPGRLCAVLLYQDGDLHELQVMPGSCYCTTLPYACHVIVAMAMTGVLYCLTIALYC